MQGAICTVASVFPVPFVHCNQLRNCSIGPVESLVPHTYIRIYVCTVQVAMYVYVHVIYIYIRIYVYLYSIYILYIRIYIIYTYIYYIYTYIYYIPYGRKFWRIGGFESNPPIFHPPKTSQCDVIIIAKS